MRGNEFLDKMELVDPAYVEEADQQPPKVRKAWLKWGGLVACLCLVTAVFALTGLEPMTIWRGLTSGYNPRLAEVKSGKLPPSPTDQIMQNSSQVSWAYAPPEDWTSDTYSNLTDLLVHLSANDGHGNLESDDGKGGYSAAHAAMEGADTVSWQGVVYQIYHGTEDWLGVYQDGVLTGVVDAPADYLFLSEGRLVAVGTERYSGDELNPVYCVRVNVFGLDDPAHPAKLDNFTQLGDFTACWMAGEKLYLLTGDGVCACGYSIFDSLEDYKPRLFHGEEQIPWPEAEIRILGAPTRVSYVAASCVDLETLEITGKRAFYGDMKNVFYGADWLALVTESTAEGAYTLQDVYTFDGSLTFTGTCDIAGVFGLEKTGRPSASERPTVKAVTKAGGVWRMAGEYYRPTDTSWTRDLFAVTFDPETGEVKKQSLQLPEAQFSIDDVLWEENRAIISAGFAIFGPEPDGFSQGARLVFAEFDGMDIALLSSDILCDRVTGIDMMYSYGSPLGWIRPFIPLATGWGSGWYLRYNGTPNGFDIYDLSDSKNPQCLYKSQGDIPEECRLDFDFRVLYTDGSANAVAVKLITPKDGDYRQLDCAWRVFYVDEEPPINLRMSLEEYPVTGFDPAAIPVW